MSQPDDHRSLRFEVFAETLAHGLAAMEDADDIADADAAWEAGGEPIPLAELEAEFGFSPEK
jgi:hypothetical protein